MSSLLSIVKPFVPGFIWRYTKSRAREMAYRRLRKELPAYQDRMKTRLDALRQKNEIIVAFQVFSVSMWKCASVLKLMQEHPRFVPFIWVSPQWQIQDEAERGAVMRKVQDFFEQAGVETVAADTEEQLRALRRPDIIFPSQPYESVSEALNKDMEQALYCYVPYCFRNTEAADTYNNISQNKYLFNFYENRHTAGTAAQLMTNGGANVVVTGHPILDPLLGGGESSQSPWKDAGGGKKKIIWAPHWVVDPTRSHMGRTSFLDIADGMLELAARYADTMQFAFKPHPLLLHELYKHPDWGRERADAYYAKWRDMGNGQLEDGPYVELFRQSDALVHDSGSFMVEYMACNKPCLYIRKEEDYPPLEAMSRQAVQAHHHTADIGGVEEFLRKVVLLGDDGQAALRHTFREKYILPPHHCSAAQNIINAILGQARAD